MAHVRIRKFNAKDIYPEQKLDNDLSQAGIAGRTIYIACALNRSGALSFGVPGDR